MDEGNLSWLRRHKYAIALLLIFVLALVLRSAFAMEPATTESTIPGDFLVSGGSDSYYHKRIIDHIVETHHHLDGDQMLNYPFGWTNPRPPLYQWTIVVEGYGLAPFFGGDLAGCLLTSCPGF